MANPYNDDDRDPSENAGGGLPVGLDTSTADRLRSLPFSAQAGSTGVATPAALPLAPPGPSSSPDDFAWLGKPSGWDPSYGLNFTPPATADPATSNPLGLPAQPGLPMAPPPSPYQQQLEGYLRQYQQMAADPLSAFFMRLQGTDPAAAPIKLIDALNTMSRQSEADQRARETHQDQLVKNEIDQWERVQQLRAQTPEDQLPAFDDYWARKLVDRHGQVMAGTPLAGQMDLDGAKALLKTDGGVKDFIAAHADADPADLAEAARIYRTEKDPAKKAELADAYLDKARTRKLAAAQPRVEQAVGQRIAALTQQNGGKPPTIQDVEDSLTQDIDTADPGTVRGQYGVSPIFAKDALSQFFKDPKNVKWFEARGVQDRGQLLDNAGVTKELRGYIVKTPTFKGLAQTGGYTTSDRDLLRIQQTEPQLFNQMIGEATAARDKVRYVEGPVAQQRAVNEAKRQEPLTDDGKRVIVDTTTGVQVPTGSFSQDSLEAAKAAKRVVELTPQQYQQHQDSLVLDGRLLTYGNVVVPQLALKPGQNFKTAAKATVSNVMGGENVLKDLDSLYSTVIAATRAAIGSSNRINQQELAAVERGLPTAWDTQDAAKRKLVMLHQLNQLSDDVRMGRVTGADITKRWDAFATENGLRGTKSDFTFTRTK